MIETMMAFAYYKAMIDANSIPRLRRLAGACTLAEAVAGRERWGIRGVFLRAGVEGDSPLKCVIGYSPCRWETWFQFGALIAGRYSPLGSGASCDDA